VLIYDLKNNELVAGKTMEDTMSLASLTKIFTSGLAYETFLKTHKRDSPEARAYVARIQRMLAQSSNEEAEAIATIFGNTRKESVTRLNEYVKPYSLVFRNVNGLDIKTDGGVGGRGTPVNLARGIRDVYFKYPELFDKTILPYNDNTNLIAGKLDFFLAGKTGFTNYSGGNLMVIIQKGITHKYLIIVLGSTEKDRFVDVEHIVKALLQLDV
jgi:D-alanyl-D-alanine carboxypeptidase